MSLKKPGFIFNSQRPCMAKVLNYREKISSEIYGQRYTQKLLRA